ncbi:MAG: SDR family oxidoreductase [Dinoroseobacter sp.]|nr:SDR family oxidoreductase [Dinoroseobacter sp.]MDJ0992849.1 SDR family oxidoreductase [Dinoroseobacter sp.]
MNILITGASSGFGTLMVADLIKAGHRVVGTVRDPNGRNAAAAENLNALGAEIVDLDVTDDASVEAGVEHTIAKLGGIDVLINNAGVGAHGLQENFSAEDFQSLFDINVFGVQRMTRAVLPSMRARQSGLIVNVSSLLGRVVLPFYGPYNASKWALEALSENYRVELSQFGVDVALVEPGGFPTKFASNLMHPSSRDRDAGYGAMANAPEAALQGFEDFLEANPQQNPQFVSDAVLSVIATAPGARPFRTTVDFIGMGDLVKPMNDQLAQATGSLFTNLGMADMLSLRVSAPEAA